MTALAIGRFAEEGPFVRARTRAIAAGYRIVGEWSPYPPETLGSGNGERGIVTAVVVATLLGGLVLFALASWNMLAAYPIDSGGRPPWAWQAFLLPAVEFSALCGAIGGVTLLFRNARLTRLHHSAFDLAEVAHASRDAFVLALGCDAGERANTALAILAEAGATHSRVVGA